MTNRDRLELLLLGMIWGTSYMFMRVAAPEFGAIALVEVRVAIAAAFLLGVLALRGGLGDLRGSTVPLTIVGVLGSALPFGLFAYAALHITAGTAAVLNASTPLFGAIVAYAWLKDRLTVARIIGLGIGFGGVVLLAWDKVAFNGGGTTPAVYAAIAASLSYGVAVNFTKKKLGHMPPMAAAAGSLVAATLLLLPLAATHWPSAAPSLKSWLCVIALGIFCTGIAMFYHFRLIARIGPAKAVTVTYLLPVFGILWGVIFLHEPVTTTMITACAVILAGTALATGSVAAPRRNEARCEGVSRA